MELSELLNDAFCNELSERIAAHHRLYSIKIADRLWEEIAARSLAAAGHNNSWSRRVQHRHGVDITLDNGYKISCKSGAWVKRRFGDTREAALKISSYRTARFPTLEEKLAFINSRGHEDITLSLCESAPGTYRLCAFVAPDLTGCLWSEQRIRWETTNPYGAYCIEKSLSHQYWMYLRSSRESDWCRWSRTWSVPLDCGV